MTDEKYVPPARCPWCGGHARVRAFTDGDCVECDRCHASGPMTMFGGRAAIMAWNKMASRVAAGTPRDNEGADYASLAGVNEHLRKSLSIAYETNDSYRDEYAALKRSHERMRRVWDATAEHLRETRERLRTATCQIEGARISGKFFEGKYHELMDDLHGDEMRYVTDELCARLCGNCVNFKVLDDHGRHGDDCESPDEWFEEE